MRFCEYQKCSQPVFGSDKNTRKGYCKSHQFARTDLDKRSIVQKAMSKEKAKRISSKLRALPENKNMVEDKKAKDADLSQNEWYLMQRELMAGKCCNCGLNTSKNDTGRFKWSIAHVFPKNIFKSVAKENSNWIELCISCHTLFDRNLATASEMKCFKKAVEQYRKFEHEVTETHKYKTLFEEYMNQI